MNLDLPAKYRIYVKNESDKKLFSEEQTISLSYEQLSDGLFGSVKTFWKDMVYLDLYAKQTLNDRFASVQWLINGTFLFKVFHHTVKNDFDNFSISIYDNTGCVCIFQELIPEHGDRGAFLEKIKHILDRFTEGFVPCADCGKELDLRKNIKNLVGAGIYCDADVSKYIQFMKK